MSDPIANSQLELACRLGALDDIAEALEDGADINCKGGSPLFVAIMAGERAAVEALVEHGVDVSAFIPGATPDDGADRTERVDFLMSCGPAGAASGGGGGSDEVAVDAKMVGALDRMIRRAGLREPFVKKRGAEMLAFSEALATVGAEECSVVVKEFLEVLEKARSGESEEHAEDAESGVETTGADKPDSPPAEELASVFDESEWLDTQAERLAEWSERYLEADELPPVLAKEYIKERKKLEAGS